MLCVLCAEPQLTRVAAEAPERSAERSESRAPERSEPREHTRGFWSESVGRVTGRARRRERLFPRTGLW